MYPIMVKRLNLTGDLDTFEDEEGEEYAGSKFGGFTDYMRRKKIKLQNLDAELRSVTNDPPIFRGVVAHVNGYTQPSLTDLHHLIVTHGGGFLQYLDGKTAVTHVIASNLTPKKKVEFARYRIVKPAWVVESVRAGKLLPWDGFRVVDEGVHQKVLGFDNGNIVSQTNTQRSSYRDQTDTSWYTSQFKNVAKAVGEDKATTDVEALQPDDDYFQNGVVDRVVLRDDALEVEEAGALRDSRDTLDSEQLPSLEHTGNEDVLGGRTGSTAVVLESHKVLSEQPGTGELVTVGLLPEMSSHVGPAGLHSAAPQSEPRQLTAEEHNARLLADPHMAKSSTANPDFLNQYYRESRLHHLSTWKADLKAQLQARAQEISSSQKIKRIPGARRYILHVDFDSFFAAVSLRNNPELAEKPVVIAHGSGPGSEIASCNYPARKFGVKNGMWMKTALMLCADLKVLPYDFKAYEEASRHFYEAILATDGTVQSVSIDEALADVSFQCIKAGGSDGKAIQEGSIFREQAKASEIAQNLRSLVKEKTGCEVSIGIGNNILLAKVALRKAKPAGQYLIKPEEILDFIGELIVTDLPGVAYSLGSKLEELGVKYVKDIRVLTKERLVNALGPKTGEKLWDYARGIDKVEVGEQVIRKSVSAEINWGIRFVTQQQADEFVQCLCDELSRRLLEQTVKGKQMTMKIMRRAADAPRDPPKNLGHGKCDVFNKSVILGVATNDKAVLGREAISILKGYGFSPGELRGLGVQVTKLEPLKPMSSTVSSLFDSSQRRLQFKKPDSLNPVPPAASSSNQDSARINAPLEATLHTPRAPSRLTDDPDPIEEVRTPEKAAATTALARSIEKAGQFTEDSKHNLLNISGTQFILPSQIDLTVLAELPAAIRAKLAPKQKQIFDSLARPDPTRSDDVVKSRSASPFPSLSDYGLPNQSQIDPAILSALPDDVRDELLAHYESETAKTRLGRSQQLLSQSPKKPKPAFSTKKTPVTPTKKQKTSNFMMKGRSKIGDSMVPTLTQSNFVAARNAKGEASAVQDEEISESFLAELPEDIRSEILVERKRVRMQTTSGLNVGSKRRKPKAPETGSDANLLPGQRRLRLPPLPEKPTFTSRKLSTLSELREAMAAWVGEFSGDHEQGPFEEDISALASYLEKVVCDELDLGKAVSVVKWLTFVINDRDIAEGPLCKSWSLVLEILRQTVQTAVKVRRLPPVDFN